MHKINARGIALIKHFEGLRLQAYPDPATGGKPWTIGYGHTGREVTPGLVWTIEKAEAVLLEDLRRFERDVGEMVTARVSGNMFSSLVSFAFNAGSAALRSSTLLRLTNAQQFQPAAAQFDRWIFAAGQMMPGLVKRRAAEKALYLDPV